MGSVKIPGVCQKKNNFYRRFRYYDKAGKRKDIYVPLPEPTDPRFAAELDRVNREHSGPAAKREGPIPGSFGALAVEFRAAINRGWTKKKRKKGGKALAANTVTNYGRYIGIIEDGSLIYENPRTKARTPVRDLDVKGLRASHIHTIIDDMADQPGKANNFLNVLKLMLIFAAQREWRDGNPARDISPLPLGEHEPWPAAVLKEAIEEAGPMLRLAIVTGLCSGQRISDCIKIQHGWLKNEILELSQIKTDVDIAISVHPWWREEINRLPKRSVTVLYDRSGKPFSSEEAIQAQIRRLMKTLGHVDEGGKVLYTFHGLRKNAACYLIEVLGSDDAVGRLLGMTAETVRHYTKRTQAYRIALDLADKVTSIPRSKMGR
jgi:integrase